MKNWNEVQQRRNSLTDLTQVEFQAIAATCWQYGERKIAKKVVDGEEPPEPRPQVRQPGLFEAIRLKAGSESFAIEVAPNERHQFKGSIDIQRHFGYLVGLPLKIVRL